MRWGRAHGRRWEAVGRRGSHIGSIGGHVRMRTGRKGSSTRMVSRRGHHSWRLRNPHRPDGKSPRSPGRVEIRRWGSIRGSARKGTIHGTHWWTHPWICFRGSPAFRTGLSMVLFTRSKAVFSVGIWHVCRVRGSWREIPRMVGARRERREWTRRKGTRREWTGREDARREGAGREDARWEDTGGKDARRERVRRRQKAQSSWRR